MKHRPYSLLLIVILLLFVPAFLYLNDPREANLSASEPDPLPAPKIETPKLDFGLALDSFIVFEKTVKPAEFLSNILSAYQVPYSTIHELSRQSDTIFSVRRIAVGKKYLVLCSREDSTKARYFIYQPNEVDYIVCNLGDSISVHRGKKEVVTEVQTLSGSINSSLYDALAANGGNPMLAMKMADIMAWTIDFYRIQKGDWFKVIFEEQKVDGKLIGYGNILAIDFNHEGKDFFGFYFQQDDVYDYFDEEANSLRKAFLKSPLKFSRLTSGFTKKRFHPVQKRWKAHLGTDYAAPTGTPILATGDGKVVEARYKKFNGNYVKILHNGTYQTQYLHMSSIKKGIKAGTFVRQGEVIGYVGSTGLATGPHVCYRFWKHGEQVNHLKEDFPPSEPVKAEHMERFLKDITELKLQLEQHPVESKPDELASLP